MPPCKAAPFLSSVPCRRLYRKPPQPPCLNRSYSKWRTFASPSSTSSPYQTPKSHAHFSLSQLPTAQPLTLTPAKRKEDAVFTYDISLPTVALLHDAFRAHDRRKAWFIYKRLWRLQTPLHPDDHSTILAYLSGHTIPALGLAHAAHVVENMQNEGWELDERDYLSLMILHMRNGDARRVAELGEEMRAKGVYPNARIWALLIVAYGKSGIADVVWNKWKQCLEELPGVEADWEVRAVTVEYLGRGGDVRRAQQLVEEVVDAFARSKGEKGVVDIRLYEALIQAYGVNGRLKDAVQIFNVLKTERPSFGEEGGIGLQTYDAIIEAYEAAGDVEGAETAWNELEALCIKHSRPPPKQYDHFLPDSVPLPQTYNRIMALQAERGNYDRVQQLFDQRNQHALPLDVDMHRHLVRAYLNGNKPQEAADAYDRMVARGFMPDWRTIRDVVRTRPSETVAKIPQ
ncbi:hypothetical protein HK104_009033 [Borealophlyctis nickersoniae]|nr:hypothetical protein HK104_009033 [Borealophlyctis nickersoniae]